MNHQLQVFTKLQAAESDNLVPERIETILDKLINITRGAQFDQLDLSDEACDEVITALDSIETRMQSNREFLGRAESIKAEYIAITLSDENFV
jgi:hypothetical protein